LQVAGALQDLAQNGNGQVIATLPICGSAAADIDLQQLELPPPSNANLPPYELPTMFLAMTEYRQLTSVKSHSLASNTQFFVPRMKP
jgi:hypothetical protein